MTLHENASARPKISDDAMCYPFDPFPSFEDQILQTVRPHFLRPKLPTQLEKHIRYASSIVSTRVTLHPRPLDHQVLASPLDLVNMVYAIFTYTLACRCSRAQSLGLTLHVRPSPLPVRRHELA